MGHASDGTGEKVYTHKTVDELKQTMELKKPSGDDAEGLIKCNVHAKLGIKKEPPRREAQR